MKKKVFYFLKEAFVSFRRNWVMSIAAVSTVFLTLFLVGSFTFFTFIGSKLIEAQENKVEIEVFLSEQAPAEKVQIFQNRITSWDEVSKVRYISKNHALKRLRVMFKDAPEILDEIPGNPLSPSLQIRLKDTRQVEKVALRIRKQPNAKEVIADLGKDIKYGQKYVPKLFAVTRIFRWAGIVTVSLLGFASLVLIVNTIRLAIFARRREVAIMRLVGASNWFIRWPFMLEGIFQGLVGAFMTILILYVLKVSLFKWQILQFFDWLGVTFDYGMLVQQFYILLLTLILGGVFIGAAGSAIALRRFLKV